MRWNTQRWQLKSMHPYDRMACHLRTRATRSLKSILWIIYFIARLISAPFSWELFTCNVSIFSLMSCYKALKRLRSERMRLHDVIRDVAHGLYVTRRSLLARYLTVSRNTHKCDSVYVHRKSAASPMEIFTDLKNAERHFWLIRKSEFQTERFTSIRTSLTYSMEQSPSWEANWFCS
jgi:hypothetical protein